MRNIIITQNRRMTAATHDDNKRRWDIVVKVH